MRSSRTSGITPARVAGLGRLRDRPDPRVTTTTALAVIAAVYALFFLSSIERGFWAIGRINQLAVDYRTQHRSATSSTTSAESPAPWPCCS